MFTTKIRTTFAVLAATFSVAAAMPAVSQAQVFRHPIGDGPHPVMPGRISAKPVDAGATGDGPATDSDCQAWAGVINGWLDDAQDELNEHGNGDKFNRLADNAKQAQDMAEDDGCFIVNPI